jgi:hypothetical protein
MSVETIMLLLYVALGVVLAGMVALAVGFELPARRARRRRNRRMGWYL